MSPQKLYGNMGSIFWPSAGTLNGRVLTEIDQQYYQSIVNSKDCAQAQANVDRLKALRGATDPNSGAVALAYCYAYEATWPKLEVWIANYCASSIQSLPGSPTNVTTSTPTTTSPSPTTTKSSGSLALLFIAGGLVYMATKKKKRNSKS